MAEGKIDTPTVTLNSGAKMPMFGLGTWLSEPGKVRDAVYHALKLGYRHIDCAALYLNEKEVGEGIKKWLDEGGKREDIFITSKLWCTEMFPDRVEKALSTTLSDLGLDYLVRYQLPVPPTLRNKLPVLGVLRTCTSSTGLSS